MYSSTERFEARMIPLDEDPTLAGMVEVRTAPYGMVCAVMSLEDFYLTYNDTPLGEVEPIVEPVPTTVEAPIPVPKEPVVEPTPVEPTPA